MFFKSLFKNKEVITFDESGYTGRVGYSDMENFWHRKNEVNSYIWINKDKETIRIQSLIHCDHDTFNFANLWSSELIHFKIQDWPDSELKQIQLVKEMLFSDTKGKTMEEEFKELVTKKQWELIVEFLGNLNFQH